MAKTKRRWIKIDSELPEFNTVYKVRTVKGDDVLARRVFGNKWLAVNFDRYLSHSNITHWREIA